MKRTLPSFAVIGGLPPRHVDTRAPGYGRRVKTTRHQDPQRLRKLERELGRKQQAQAEGSE